MFGLLFACRLPGSCETVPNGNSIHLYIHARGKAATRDPPRRTAGAAVPGLDLSAGSGMLCRANHAAAVGPAREPFAQPLCVPRCSCRSSREAGGGGTGTHTGSTGRANWVRQTGIAEWLGAVVPSSPTSRAAAACYLPLQCHQPVGSLWPFRSRKLVLKQTDICLIKQGETWPLQRWIWRKAGR